MENIIRDIVFEALNNSFSNGYDPTANAVEDTVHDLLTYDADLENYSATILEPFVREWIEAQS